MSTIPPHGPIACRACWSGCDGIERTFDEGRAGQFKAVNDPGAWGSADPRIMVLGQTKGLKQRDRMARARRQLETAKTDMDRMAAEFEYARVAFSDCRTTLHSLLASLGLIDPNADFDALFRATEPDWHWGSITRCTLAAWNKEIDPKTGQPKGWSSASGLVGKAYGTEGAGQLPATCTKTFLTDLPDRLKLVILLGNDDTYVERVRDTVAAARRDVSGRTDVDVHPDSPGVAWTTPGVTWVHMVHPSGNAVSHHNAFKAGTPNTTQGEKARAARRAIASAGL